MYVQRKAEMQNMRNGETERKKTKCSTKCSGPEEQARITEEREEMV